jgi:energy-coupling factor transporter transmembrane protein EcfT
MSEALQNILYVISGGILLLVGVVFLRFVLRFTWKIVRVVLLLLSVLLIMGYFFGFLDISFHL